MLEFEIPRNVNLPPGRAEEELVDNFVAQDRDNGLSYQPLVQINLGGIIYGYNTINSGR